MLIVVNRLIVVCISGLVENGFVSVLVSIPTAAIWCGTYVHRYDPDLCDNYDPSHSFKQTKIKNVGSSTHSQEVLIISKSNKHDKFAILHFKNSLENTRFNIQ